MEFYSGPGGKPGHRFLGMDRSRVFVPCGDTGSQAGGASGRTLPRGLNTIQRRKPRCQSGPEGLAAFSSFHIVFATASGIAGLISPCAGSVIGFWRCRLSRFRRRTGCADRRPGWFRTVALRVGTTAGEPLAFCEKRMVAGSNSRKLPLSSTQPPRAWAGGGGQSGILGTNRGIHRPFPSTSAPSVHLF
jgi:hypothetical protein